MSVAMRLPSRIGTITLRSTMATDSSSVSVLSRAATTCGSRVPPRCAKPVTVIISAAVQTVHLAFMGPPLRLVAEELAERSQALHVVAHGLQSGGQRDRQNQARRIPQKAPQH